MPPPLAWSLRLCLFALATVCPAADFALRDGDKLVFLGDSITAARGYPKFVEQYTLMRYPERRVAFLNAGEGGDTAHGCLARLDRDVLDRGATVVTVAFGINDIGWGTKADPAHRAAYLDGIREIIRRCQARGVRVFICSPAITDEDPDKAEKGYLQGMVDEGLEVARGLGAGTIDLMRGMREVQRRVVAANAHEADPAKRTRMHVQDGVHLNDLGQLAMGHAMLKGLGAPAFVSAAGVGAVDGTVTKAEGCRVTDVRVSPEGVEFTRLDEGLPMSLGILGALQYRWVNWQESFSGYTVQVSGLPPGDYELRADGRLFGRFSAQRLARGENISVATVNGWEPGGPWDAQSDVVKELVDARDKLAAAEAVRRRFLASTPGGEEMLLGLAEADTRMVAAQRVAARPRPTRFVITRVATPTGK
jgi:lysophospholipase L1-like esterase